MNKQQTPLDRITEEYAARMEAVRQIREIFVKFPDLERELFSGQIAKEEPEMDEDIASNGENVHADENGKQKTRERVIAFFQKNGNQYKAKRDIAKALDTTMATVGSMLTLWGKRGVFEKKGLGPDITWRLSDDYQAKLKQ